MELKNKKKKKENQRGAAGIDKKTSINQKGRKKKRARCWRGFKHVINADVSNNTRRQRIYIIIVDRLTFFPDTLPQNRAAGAIRSTLYPF
jgi:hypothetical protein